MAKKRTTQIQILEEARGEEGISVTDFSKVLGVSRQWYHDRRENGLDVLALKDLSELATLHNGFWLGELAVKCIRLIDVRFVPCVCETEVGDHGMCPRHPSLTSASTLQGGDLKEELGKVKVIA